MNEIEALRFIEDDIINKYEGYTIEQIALSKKVPTRIIELKFKSLGLF